MNAGPFRGGRGRALDISHARGRGRGDFGDNRTHIAEDISEREGTRNHELGRGHHRGGGFKEGHRGRFGHGAGRGRGRGHIEYDADFDRGKTTQDRRAESQKQLFQAPMGYKSEFASDPTERRAESATRKDNHHLRENGKQDTRSAQVAEPEHRHSEDEGRRETQPTDLRDLQEATATPGLINTGIDVTATQGDSRKGKQGGERKQRGRGREGRDRRSARDASSDGRQGRERDDPGRSFDVNASVHPVERPPFPVGVPPPPHPFERVPPPFMPPPPPPPAGPYDQYHGRPPPPPDAFFRFPFGPPMPPPGEGWPHSPHGSPPFRHRGPPPPFLPDSQEQGSASRHNRSMKPDSIPGALKGQVTRSVRDASSRYSQDRDTDGTGSPLPAARQLFDPTKHDPVKFSSSKSAALSSTGTSASTLDDRSVAVSSTRSNMSSLSVASSDYKSRHSSQKDALLDEVESTSSGAGDNALLRELKASYKEILSIEAKLQDEDKFAKTAIEEEAEASGREDLRSPKETRSDEYWTQLIQLHREWVVFSLPIVDFRLTSRYFPLV